MKRLLILSMLVLAGCDPALWRPKPMTRAQQIEQHCKDVGEQAKTQIEHQQEMKDIENRKAGGFSGGFSAGMVQAEQAHRARDVAYRECKWKYGS